MAKLSSNDVMAVKWFFKHKPVYGCRQALAEMFGVSRPDIGALCKEKTWTSVSLPDGFTPTAEQLALFDKCTQARFDRKSKALSEAHTARNAEQASEKILEYVHTTRWCADHCQPGWLNKLSIYFALSTVSLFKVGKRQSRQGIPENPEFTPSPAVMQLVQPYIRTTSISEPTKI